MSKKTETKIVAYKGLDKNFRCRGFQYEVGQTYTHDGTVEVCDSGFHACENPLDVLDYYPLLGGDGTPNRFAIVEQSGTIDRNDDDSKIASSKITIMAELSVGDFIKHSVAWIIDRCKPGMNVQAASGYCSQLAASGNGSRLVASGNGSHLAASGNGSQLAASGNGSKLVVSGDNSQLAASGNGSKLVASGDNSQLAASGNGSQLAASGNGSKLAASGDHSHLAASGNRSRLVASGDNSVIAASAPGCVAKGALGTWIALAEWGDNGQCVGFATGRIGDDGLEPDVYYIARGGKLVPA